MSIVDAIYTYLPAKRKQTPSGWTKFNAVCCHHNGTSADTRQRGGIIRNSDGCSYHCFNCGFKASYVSGRHLSRKMRQLLAWMGADDDVISKLSLEALKIESDERALAAVTLPTFEDRDLPEGSLRINEWLAVADQLPEDLCSNLEAVVTYALDRGLDPQGDFYWTPLNGYLDRLIIPFRYEGRIVGNTARKVTEGKPKYISDQTPGYVFNLDRQQNNRRYLIVVEGPIDALSTDSVAILGADIMDKQAMLINRLDREVIVLPDRDADGSRTVERALELGWSVSFPDFEGCKDAADAVQRYGKIWTVQQIIDHRVSGDLRVRLGAKTWFQGI